MVPASPSADAEAPREQADWLTRIAAILSVARGGIVVALHGAHGAAARPLVLALLEGHGPGDPEGPTVEVCFSPRELLNAPHGARVVLLGADRDPAWINRNRPIVHERGLAVFLWDTGPELQVLRREAPDFLDWVSHRIDVPAFAPAHAVAELRRLLAQLRWVAMQGMAQAIAELGDSWIELEGLPTHGELLGLLESNDVIVGDLRRDEDVWRLLITHAQVQWKHRVLLNDAAVIPPLVPLVDGATKNWEEASRALQAEGIMHARLEAALADLEGDANIAHDLACPRVLAMNDPHMRVLGLAATRRIDGVAARLALECGLVDVAESWARAAWHGGDSPAGLVLIRALAARSTARGRPAKTALAAYEEACDVERTLHIWEGGGVDPWDFYSAMASLAFSAGTFDEFHQRFDRSIPMALEHRYHVFLRSIAYIQETLGRSEYAAGRLEQAALHFDEALKLRERFITTEPELEDGPRALASCLGDIGDIFLRRRMLDEARRSYARSRSLYESLARQVPDNLTLQLELSTHYRREAELLAAEGREQEALKWLDLAIDLLERLRTTDLDPSIVEHFLGVATWRCAQLSLAVRQPERAAIAFREAERLLATPIPWPMSPLLDLDLLATRKATMWSLE